MSDSEIDVRMGKAVREFLQRAPYICRVVIPFSEDAHKVQANIAESGLKTRVVEIDGTDFVEVSL